MAFLFRLCSNLNSGCKVVGKKPENFYVKNNYSFVLRNNCKEGEYWLALKVFRSFNYLFCYKM